MKVFIILAAFVAVAVAQYADAPIPYNFKYISETEDGGRSSHEESGDGNGRVSGTYTVDDNEGNSRVVEYVADEEGYRANIRTNELGTANMNPADVTIESSAPGANDVGGAAAGAAVAPSRPVTPVRPAGGAGGAGLRYVLVPVTDPRARAAGY